MLIEMLNEMLIKMPFEVLIEVLFAVLIEVLFDNLMKFAKGCIRRWGCVRCTNKLTVMPKDCNWLWDGQVHWRISEFLSKNCIWLWNNQMHWRVFDFVRRLHLTLKRSDALTNFRWCQKGCTLMIECIGGFFDFVKKLHLILKQSDALTISDYVRKVASWWSNALAGCRFCQKNCIWLWNNQMHWRIFNVISLSRLQV